MTLQLLEPRNAVVEPGFSSGVKHFLQQACWEIVIILKILGSGVLLTLQSSQTSSNGHGPHVLCAYLRHQHAKKHWKHFWFLDNIKFLMFPTGLSKTYMYFQMVFHDPIWMAESSIGSDTSGSAVILSIILTLLHFISFLYSLGQWNWVADVTESQFDRAWSQKNAAQTPSDCGVGPEKGLFSSL